jgi:hypothetical protein
MVSLEMALRLREYGLEWEPKLHDFFSIPNTAVEERLFVVSDMMIDVQRLFGRQMITFNGAVEWSLDYITVTEAVWRPSEGQLRTMLMGRLMAKAITSLMLESTNQRYTCRVTYGGKLMAFEASSASDAYARAFIFLLKESNGRA